MSMRLGKLFTHATAVVIGAAVGWGYAEQRMSNLLGGMEALGAITQIRWNTTVLELLARGDSAGAVDLLDRQVDSKTSTLNALRTSGMQIGADDIQLLERALRERRVRGKETGALELAIGDPR